MSRQLWNGILSVIPVPVISKCQEVPTPGKARLHLDPVFDVSYEVHISEARDSFSLISTARRCMHELCWLPAARAYTLGLYVDDAYVNRARTYPSESIESDIFDKSCPKTFVLQFASEKDIRHIRNGFGRSLESFLESRCYPDAQAVVQRFLAVLDGVTSTHKGDKIKISCNPSHDRFSVQYNASTSVDVSDHAEVLTEWVHWTYIGSGGDIASSSVKYPTMQKQMKTNYNSLV
jgi:hypothetical protein